LLASGGQDGTTRKDGVSEPVVLAHGSSIRSLAVVAFSSSGV